MNGSLGTAVGLGAVTGLRSMTGAALLARELASRGGIDGWRARLGSRHRPRLEQWLAEPAVARTLGVMAVGELLADKMPGVPDRVSPAPLLGRAVIGGLLGSIVVPHDRRAAGALAGAAGALAGAVAGWWLRREAARATDLPDVALAVAEDTVAVAAARELVAEV